jgi:cytochrome c oxidase subunit 2
MNYKTNIDNTFILIVVISAVLLLIVTFTMLYFMFRYNKKRNPQAGNITGSTTLEVLWTVIPLILVLVIFFSGWSDFRIMRNVPPDAMVIKVTARMWMWSFEYPNNKKTDTLLYVPLNKPIKMEIHSADVNHSFYLPAFRVKEDAIPGRTNYMWFYPDQLGEFTITCAEYCGMGHSFMQGKLIVMPPDKFNEWLNANPNPADSTKADSLKVRVDSTSVNNIGIDSMKLKKSNKVKKNTNNP